jgi:hypothetical protein
MSVVWMRHCDVYRDIPPSDPPWMRPSKGQSCPFSVEPRSCSPTSRPFDVNHPVSRIASFQRRFRILSIAFVRIVLGHTDYNGVRKLVFYE